MYARMRTRHYVKRYVTYFNCAAVKNGLWRECETRNTFDLRIHSFAYVYDITWYLFFIYHTVTIPFNEFEVPFRFTLTNKMLTALQQTFVLKIFLFAKLLQRIWNEKRTEFESTTVKYSQGVEKTFRYSRGVTYYELKHVCLSDIIT